ncbi:MAG TPA: hypothetical protein VE959_11445 [Bryobacteraceae bacterium]|nr:hypothetical protein [Bryobacteraceae bacterium]
MNCNRCRKSFSPEQNRCPHCGEPNPAASGLFQTSTVLISTGGSDKVYRSVDEVPAGLRTRLLKSTNSANSATILIADQRGRKEIAKAMRNLPGPAQRRLRNTILGKERAPSQWLTPARKRLILAVVLCLTVLAIVAIFSRRFEDLFR